MVWKPALTGLLEAGINWLIRAIIIEQRFSWFPLFLENQKRKKRKKEEMFPKLENFTEVNKSGTLRAHLKGPSYRGTLLGN